MSIVRIGLAARAKGISRLAAQTYWRTQHAEIFSRLPGLLSYVQNHAVLDGRGEPLGPEPGFDIFSEVEFEDEATLERVGASAYYRDEILADERNLLDASRRTFLMTRRHVLTEIPESGLIKVALFLRSNAPLAAIAVYSSSIESECGFRARASVVYLVDHVGGTIVRPINVVLQHYFKDVVEARRWYVAAQHLSNSEKTEAPKIACGVIAEELEIVHRGRADRPEEVHR